MQLNSAACYIAIYTLKCISVVSGLRNEDPQGTTYSPSAPHRDCIAHCFAPEDLEGDAECPGKGGVGGWPVNSAVELTMIRCTSVDKVRNGWGIGRTWGYS